MLKGSNKLMRNKKDCLRLASVVHAAGVTCKGGQDHIKHTEISGSVISDVHSEVTLTNFPRISESLINRYS